MLQSSVILHLSNHMRRGLRIGFISAMVVAGQQLLQAGDLNFVCAASQYGLFFKNYIPLAIPASFL